MIISVIHIGSYICNQKCSIERTLPLTPVMEAHAWQMLKKYIYFLDVTLVVTLARPSPTSSLKVTDRSFQYASPHLWNQLPSSLREPVSPLYAYLNPSFSSPLSPSITPSLFHSKLKTYLFGTSFPHRSLTIDISD